MVLMNSTENHTYRDTPHNTTHDYGQRPIDPYLTEVYIHIIHLDIRRTLPQPLLWY